MLGVMISPAAVALAGEAPARPAPLDAFAGQLYAAIGLRRMLSTYTGPLIRARRSSNNEPFEVGAGPDGWLDTAALLGWAGSSTVLVSTIFDQTGNARHAGQTSTTSQPRIVNAGVLDTGPNGKPMLVFDGSDDLLEFQNTADFAQNIGQVTLAATCVRRSGSTSQQVIFAPTGLSGGATRASLAFLSTSSMNLIAGGRRLDAEAYGRVASSAGSAIGLWYRAIARLRYIAAQADIMVNGSLVSGAFQSAGLTSNTAQVRNALIGATHTPGELLAGAVGCGVIARSSLDLTALDGALSQLMP